MGLGRQSSSGGSPGEACTSEPSCSESSEVQGAAAGPGQPPAAPDWAAPPPAAALPPAFSHPVPHFQQAFNWDCGLACVLMVLRALGQRHQHMASLMQLCPTQSIWTIDLAHLLAACGARVVMTTVTLGANQAYSSERFYAEHMQADSARVEALFRTAADKGVAVHQRSLPLADLKALLLGGRCLLVALVDKLTLCGVAPAQRAAHLAAAAAGLSPGPPQPPAARGEGPAAAAAAGAAGGEGEAALGYLGHYVVLCGYDGGSEEFEYRDPSADTAQLWVPAARLEAARLCWGTDEDLLLVEVPAAVTAGSGSSGSNGTSSAAGQAAAPQQPQPEPGDPGPACRVVYG